MSKYLVSSSPHITSGKTTKNIMLDVIIALMPAVIAMVAIYGLYPLMITLISVGTCVLSEFLFNKIRKKEQSINDLSAVVTGIILALNLPPVVPIYVPVVGGVFAIVIVKMLFGGIGRNFANPAITARIFLMLAWTSVMTKFVLPVDWSTAGGAGLVSYFYEAFGSTFPSLPDAVTGATPLASVKSAFEAGLNPANGINFLDMFLGRIGGSAGEVSAIAILIGGIYLLIRRVIDWKIPTIYIGTTVLFTAIFYANSGYVGEYILSYLLGGGLLFGAFFMATDYATSPNTNVAVIIYSVGLGFLTVLIRRFSSMNEGVSYAILLMNVVTPLLDKIKVRPFGTLAKTPKDVIDEIKLKREEKKRAKAEKDAEASEGGVNG